VIKFYPHCMLFIVVSIGLVFLSPVATVYAHSLNPARQLCSPVKDYDCNPLASADIKAHGCLSLLESIQFKSGELVLLVCKEGADVAFFGRSTGSVDYSTPLFLTPPGGYIPGYYDTFYVGRCAVSWSVGLTYTYFYAYVETCT